MSVQSHFEALGQAHLFAGNSHHDELMQNLEKFENPRGYLQDVKLAIEYSKTIASAKTYCALPATSFHSTIGNNSKVEIWNEMGLQLIKEAKVGIILMAGGQGTRLGSSEPKGCYNVGLPSNASLFQLQSERIIKLEQLSKASRGSLPLYIMTSELTRLPTENYFKENNYFSLLPSQVIFFNQGTLPAVDLSGTKLLLNKDQKSLVESPDGNGGLYRALHENGIIGDLISKGIEHIHMYCVDNILVKVADPIFIGFSASNKFNVATKVVRKSNPDEKVGLIVMDEATRRPCIIEYSEISHELSHERDEPSGLLKLRAGNIVNHYYNVHFLQEMIPRWISSREWLPYHIAKKKIPSIDPSTGQFTNPTLPNGIKLEQFIFDVFPSVELDKFGCLEVEREEEFSPLKNAPGSATDSPEVCREMYLQRGTNWLTNAGAIVEKNNFVEVCPLTSYSGEGLHSLKGKQFKNNEIV